LRVAIVHDYLVQYGGAERVVEALHELWPEAPVYTSMHEPRALPAAFADMDVRTSFMQHLPVVRRQWKLGLPLYPRAFGALDLSGYDLVVSSSSGWAHGVSVAPGAVHVVYCHNPPRWLYRTRSYGAAERIAAAPLLPLLRRWDRRAARKPTAYVANSAAVRERIFAAYGRHAQVLHPPVRTSRFRIEEPDDYYLCASRLNSYKRIDLAIEACRRLGRRLVVAGDGPARRSLQRSAGGGVEFTGRVDDDALARLLERCRALIVPAEEDFCITAVEAMAAGRPVIAYARGGALETVVPRRTGVLFEPATPESLGDAIRRLELLPIDPGAIRAHARRFDEQRFRDELLGLVAEVAPAAARPARVHEREHARERRPQVPA
jgi:glycosyltransferase involved in cell wall biosynthesis